MSSPKASYLRSFLLSFFFALISAIIATRYFPEVSEMAACALTAFGLNQLLQNLLDYNRRSIWEDKHSPWLANRRLATEFIFIFLGIFSASSIIELTFPGSFADISLSSVYRNDFTTLVSQNVGVLFVGLSLAAIYRSSGLVLVLAWNAVHWADSIFSYLNIILQDSGSSKAIGAMLILMPHLIMEALAYILASLGAVFISQALNKYSLRSKETRRVVRAALVLLGFSIVILVAACAVEVYFAQPAFHFVRSGAWIN